MSESGPKMGPLVGSVKVELDLSNCRKKADIKSASGVATLHFGEKVDLTSLKPETAELDIGQSETIQLT